jgi:opacity protein-like surface antigen
MRKQLMSSAATAAIMAVIYGAPAMAADMPVKAPRMAAPPPVCTWCGFYVGGHLGYGWAKSTGWDSGVPGDGGERLSPKAEGALLGFHAGYNWQFGGWVFGVEGDLSATLGWKKVITTTVETTSHVRNEVEALASIRARLGWSFDRALLYATGGVAWARHRTIGISTPVDNVPNSFRWSTGWVAGGGIEWKYNPNFSVRLEGLHYVFNKNTFNIGTTGFGRLKNITTIRVGASWHLQP